MSRRERGEVLEAPELPLDLQIEILKRLPVKSLARFKCVSKLWSSFMHSQGYLFPSPPRLFIWLLRENPSEYVILSLASISSTAFDLDMTKQVISGHIVVVLRGLILYKYSGQVCIYNPTTGQRVTLPSLESKLDDLLDDDEECIEEMDYFFGYDPVLDQYKVLCTVVICIEEHESRYTQHWVFVLEAGSSWKIIDFYHPHSPQRQRVFINGVIYYVADCLMNTQINFDHIFEAISFDVRSEEFNVIQLPHLDVSKYVKMYGLDLIEYGGKPTIIDYTHLRENSLMNLWVLEDAGTWSKKSLVLQSCHMHFFPSNILLKVIGTTQNGEVVFKPYEMSSPYYILYYDLHKNDVRRVDIRGISEQPLRLALMDTGENIMPLKI